MILTRGPRSFGHRYLDCKHNPAPSGPDFEPFAALREAAAISPEAAAKHPQASTEARLKVARVSAARRGENS